MVRSIIVGTAAVFALAGTAVAQQQQAAPQSVSRAAVVSQLDSTFKAVDTNHDGFISQSELSAQQNKELQALEAQARAKLQADFKRLDTNKDGQLSFSEFAAVASVKPTQTAAQMFQGFDANKDGKISAEEFKAQRLGLFDKLDANHDGVVTADEMRRASGAK